MQRKYSFSLGIQEMQIKPNDKIVFHILCGSNALLKYHKWYYDQWNTSYIVQENLW